MNNVFYSLESITTVRNINQITIKQVCYVAKKDLIALNGNKDICKEAQNASDDIANLLAFFGIRPACPFKQVSEETYRSHP